MSLRDVALVSLFACCLTQQQECRNRFQEAQCNGECKWDPTVPACKRICYLENVAYTGDMPGQPITPQPNKEACKKHCFDTSGCEYFTYYPGTGNCHLQDNSASRIAQAGAIAGPYEMNECLEVASTLTTGSAGSTSAGSATGATGSSTGTGSGTVNGLGSNSFSPTGSSLQMPAGAGDSSLAGAESMPQDVGSAMAVGSAQAGGSFSGLNAQIALKSMPAVQHCWQVGGLFAVALFLGAFVYHRRSQTQTKREAQKEALVTNASAE